MRGLFASGFIAGALVLAAPRAAFTQADEVADFYRGRNVTLLIGSGVGGSFDMGGRLIAQHLRRFIPGNPNIVVQNMAGASGVRAAEYFHSVAPRDGSAIADIQPSIVLNKALDPAARYDPSEFFWIGRLRERVNFGLVWHEAPARTIEEARVKEVIFAANSATGYTGMIPWAVNRIAGTKIKVVTGYESEATEWLAIQRNEAHGIGSASLTGVPQPDWTANGLVRAMYAIGLNRSRIVPYAPTLVEIAGNDLDRKAMTLLASAADIGEMLFAPPGVPEARRNALRRAFDAMMRDPEDRKSTRLNSSHT